jgi:hypothetical protein
MRLNNGIRNWVPERNNTSVLERNNRAHSGFRGDRARANLGRHYRGGPVLDIRGLHASCTDDPLSRRDGENALQRTQRSAAEKLHPQTKSRQELQFFSTWEPPS